MTNSNENRQFHEKAQTEPNRGPVIGEVQKNVSETVRVEVLDYQGKPFVDVRVYREDGKPTHKGITMRANVCRELIPIMAEAIEAAENAQEASARPETPSNTAPQPQTTLGEGDSMDPGIGRLAKGSKP